MKTCIGAIVDEAKDIKPNVYEEVMALVHQTVF